VTVLAAASSSSKTTTANPIVSLLPLILIFGLAYVFFLRPRAQAARRQRDTLMELSAGDEVLTGAGIFGTVLDVESDRVTLETAPGTRITVLRSTIARKLGDPADQAPSWDEHDEDEAHDAYQDYEHDHADDEHAEHDDEHAEHEGEPAGHDVAHETDSAEVAGQDEDADDHHTPTDEPEGKTGPDGSGDRKK
jgi:preprotein translocase subunit YajC